MLDKLNYHQQNIKKVVELFVKQESEKKREMKLKRESELQKKEIELRIESESI